ncbi:MAG TPA: DUF1800 domain-containing protein [Phycisphaerae bacterium]|nr:DUF1800 domain-containing protein [Phycisphaerae bacterium]
MKNSFCIHSFCIQLCVGLFAAAALAAPMPELKPATEWDAGAAAHLLRRAGFGGTPAEVQKLASMTLEQAVASLVDYESIRQTDPDFDPVDLPEPNVVQKKRKSLEPDSAKELNQQLRQLSRLQMEDLRAWWMRRMIETPRPLEEKMTLFWHGYFTSGFREVRSSQMMFDQNMLLRKYALGNFRDLLIKISQNPAMLRYLDSESNRKDAPNENYARELLELFTMGEGNYGEKDIKEAARALTGWTIRNGEFASVGRMHDTGEKTFLGQTGNFDGEDVIDIILSQPATAQHLARKLLLFFVTPEPSQEMIDALATEIRGSGYDMREVMRRLFSSQTFYAPDVRHSLIKSPVQLVVGTIRSLEIEPSDLSAFVAATKGMGQQLFQPPNVKGWDGDRKWITTATIYARYNFASALLTGTGTKQANRMMGEMGGPMRHQRMVAQRFNVERSLDADLGIDSHGIQVEQENQPPYNPMAIIRKEGLRSADQVLNHFVDRLLGMKVDHLQRRQLRQLLANGKRRFDAQSNDGVVRTLTLINAILAMPEYQAF